MAEPVNVSPQPPESPVYLGDGLYAEFDGWQVRLWADRGPDGLHEVFLEPEVLVSFLRYVDQLKRYTQRIKDGTIGA